MKAVPFLKFHSNQLLFCRENMGMYVFFKPIWEHNPLVKPLPRTSISICACAFIHKNQISIQLLLWEKMWKNYQTIKRLENESTFKVVKFLGKATLKKAL